MKACTYGHPQSRRSASTKHHFECPNGLLPDEAFYRHRGTRDGLSYWCRDCTKRHQKIERELHPEREQDKNKRRTIERRWARNPHRSPLLPANHTGYKGVSVTERVSTRDYPGETITRFKASIYHQGKRISLGYHDSPEVAARAYDAYIKAHDLRRETNF